MAKDKVVVWQSQKSINGSLDDILGVNQGKAFLTDRDITLLETLLRYNFLTVDLAKRLWLLPTRTLSYRFKRLYDWGLIDRGSFAKEQKKRQMVFTLSRRGFKTLIRLNNFFALLWAKDWEPRSETGSQRLSVLHELGCNEVCISLSETAQALNRPVVNWEGPRESTQRFSTPSGWHTLSPDATLTLENGQPLFIEYERSGRNSKIQSKAQLMRIYLLSGQWQERYIREPWVIYAIPLGLGTQGVVGGSYGGIIVRANMTGARNYLILDEYAWTSGTWMATKGNGTVVDLWEEIPS